MNSRLPIKLLFYNVPDIDGVDEVVRTRHPAVWEDALRSREIRYLKGTD